MGHSRVEDLLHADVKTVLVVESGDKVALRPIKIDDRIGEFYIVTEGLKPGERVIVDGLQKARPGSPVNPTAAGSSPPAAKAEAKGPEKPPAAKPAQKAGGK